MFCSRVRFNVLMFLHFLAVLPATAIQISSGEGGQGIHTLTMTNSTAGGAIVQYAQGQEFFVPGTYKNITPFFFNYRNNIFKCFCVAIITAKNIYFYQKSFIYPLLFLQLELFIVIVS